MQILQINNISKQYQKTLAVDQVSIDIPKGIVFGLLGPNGAGKTSIIRMITQITSPDEGQILFNGEKLKPEHVHQIGYMPEERGLYKKMKVGDHLVYLGELRGMDKGEIKREIEFWFDRLSIDGWYDKKVKELSKGMQQKIQFISTVIHKPQLLILDEPFSGLDPINANLIRNELDRMVNENGLTVIFSTHRMEQVEEVCDEIVLINKGKKVLDGELYAIKQRFKNNEYVFEFDSSVNEILNHNEHIEWLAPNKFKIIVEQEQEASNYLKMLLDQGMTPRKFEEVLPSINDIFIQIVEENN